MIILDIENPNKNCSECALHCKGYGDTYCKCTGLSTSKHTHYCPILQELPDEYGRLIDADSLIKKLNDAYKRNPSFKGIPLIMEMIKDENTIIHAHHIKKDKIKSLDEVQAEKTYGDVYTMDYFIQMVMKELLISSDGTGHPHDGYRELTDKNVWTIPMSELKKYPYVRWYNK